MVTAALHQPSFSRWPIIWHLRESFVGDDQVVLGWYANNVKYVSTLNLVWQDAEFALVLAAGIEPDSDALDELYDDVARKVLTEDTEPKYEARRAIDVHNHMVLA